MNEAKIVGPIAVGTRGRALKLVRGDQTLGELVYWPETGTVVHVDPGSGPVFDRLVQAAKARGLLHDKNIPDSLQHDREQE